MIRADQACLSPATVGKSLDFFRLIKVNRKDDSRPLVILDEIHKFRGWKNYLKGVYDRDAENYSFLISGSGRMDVWRRGGDSLAGLP